MDQSGDNVDGQAPSTGSSLRWPPPGLERLQGDVWNIVRSGTLAVLILVFPLLLSISLRQDFWSLGPLGRAWWIILITTGVGMGLVLETFVALFRLLRRASKAVERGYRWVKSRFVCKSGGSSSPSARLLGRPPVSGGVRGRGNAGRPRRVWS